MLLQQRVAGWSLGSLLETERINGGILFDL